MIADVMGVLCSAVREPDTLQRAVTACKRLANALSHTLNGDLSCESQTDFLFKM